VTWPWILICFAIIDVALTWVGVQYANRRDAKREAESIDAITRREVPCKVCDRIPCCNQCGQYLTMGIQGECPECCH
jgi:hypothetical protein